MHLQPGMIKETVITKKPDGTIVKTEVYCMQKQGNENDQDFNNIMDQFKKDIHSHKEANTEVKKIPQKTQISEKQSSQPKSTDFIQEALKVHNDYRSKHSAPPLVINEELNKIAQQYAEKIAQSGNFAHSGSKFHGDHMGENLYMCSGFKLTGKNMTKAWYDEIHQYDFSKAIFSSGIGHFTQVVWVNSKEVGFGVAQAKNGSYYGVANYYPAGNFLGKFVENVKKS